jgi:hypothetical protein
MDVNWYTYCRDLTMMATVENKTFTTKNEFTAKRLFQFKDKPVDCTSVHCQGVHGQINSTATRNVRKSS